MIIFLSVYAILCAAISILFNTVWMLSFIPSESMEDTIKKGDLVLASRIEAEKLDINRYDILIFTPLYEADTDTLIKRVIGLPGEVIKIENGKVFADGAELNNSFIKEPQDDVGVGMGLMLSLKDAIFSLVITGMTPLTADSGMSHIYPRRT